MPQRHDIGQHKRTRETPGRTDPINGEALARDLVKLGLASPFILEGFAKNPEHNTAYPHR